MTQVISLAFLIAASLTFAFGLTPLRSAAAPTTFDLRLTGAQENPPVSDDPARATARFIFDATAKRLSWTLSVEGVTPQLITGAHIHRGATGINGPRSE